MNENVPIATLANDMRALYGFLYKEEDYRRHLLSRVIEHMDRRHLVRYLVRRERETTLEAVAEAESLLTGSAPVTHDTILNSIRAVKNGLNTRYKGLMQRLCFIYETCLHGPESSFEVPYLGRIAEFKKEKDHTKSVLLSALVEHGLVHPTVMQVMLNEHRPIGRDFLEELLESETADVKRETEEVKGVNE